MVINEINYYSDSQRLYIRHVLTHSIEDLHHTLDFIGETRLMDGVSRNWVSGVIRSYYTFEINKHIVSSVIGINDSLIKIVISYLFSFFWCPKIYVS